MIFARDIVLRYGPRTLFDAAGFVVHPRDRVGLVGPNGAGKSTLLKMLAGELEPERGEILFPKNCTVGYLAQEIPDAADRTLSQEAALAFEEVLNLRAKVDSLSRELATLDPESPAAREALETLADWEFALEDAEESRLNARVQTVLHGLGFSQTDGDRPCAEFSGGWRMRIALAKLLLRRPSLLLLDEPTNHLDVESVVWLEQYLKTYRGMLVLVSHDRRLLNTLTTRTLAIDGGKVEAYSGNYDVYETESAARRENLERAAKNQARAVAKVERFIERFRAKSSKAAQVQSRIKALEKVERIETQTQAREIAFSFPPSARCGRVVLRLAGIQKSFGEKRVLDGVDLQIERGERIAIVGVNGAGKSTLVRLMAGALPFEAGTRELGLNVSLSYFAQHQTAELNPERTALEEAESAAPPGEGRRARDLLGAFLLSGDDALKPVRVLSGGEKNRLALAKMLLKAFNFLILDEPTNHLDMRSKRVLQDAVRAYDGTVVVVSHDRDFVDPLVSKVVEVAHGKVRVFLGNVSDYAEKVRLERAATPEAADNGKAPNAPHGAKARRVRSARIVATLAPLKKAVAAAEADIERLEADRAAAEARLSEPDFYKSADAPETLRRYEALKCDIEAAYAAWERAAQTLETTRAALEAE